MEKKENKFLKQAMDELGYLSGEPDFQRLIEARVGFLKDEQAFEQAGLKRGKKEKAIEIAKNMLSKKISIKDIVELTGLTEDEVKKLEK